MKRTDPLIDFVQTRINEVEDETVRRAYTAIAGIAIGCPGCGSHGGPPHACPGRVGRPDGGWINTGDEYNPWANILRKLAMLWSNHSDYDIRWNLELTPFEICELPDEGHTYAYYEQQNRFICTNCGQEEPGF